MIRIWPVAATALLGAIALFDVLKPDAAFAQSRSDEEIGEIVREYLLENPEVIFEAVEIYQQRQQALARAASQEAAKEWLPEILDAPVGHVIPSPSGRTDVIVVEFFDYNCGFCRQATDFVFSLQDENENLQVVLQELPVTNPNSRGPALAALSVAGTDDYVRYHRAMMTSPGLVDANRAEAIANDLGLPDNLINGAFEEGDVQDALHARLDRSMDIADALGIDGTPAFLVASRDGAFVDIVSGFNTEAVLAAIDQAKRTSAQ